MNTRPSIEARLRDMASTSPAASDLVVAADVARGRAAVHRFRRRRQMWAAGGLATAAIVAGGALASSTPADPAPLAAGRDEAVTSSGHGIQLVAYHGAQHDGYVVGKLPVGFRVDLSDRSMLLLVPTDHPSLGSPGDTAGEDGTSEPFAIGDAIMVSRERSFSYEQDRHEVTINQQPALVSLSEGDDPATEVQFHTDGHVVSIQIPGKYAFTDAQIVDFAQSISVTGDPAVLGG